MFLLSSLVTGLRFMSILLLVLELWQLSFTRDWSKIRKSEIPPAEVCPISGDWGKLGILNLARMFLIKSYWMLQNARVTVLTISESYLTVSESNQTLLQVLAKQLLPFRFRLSFFAPKQSSLMFVFSIWLILLSTIILQSLIGLRNVFGSAFPVFFVNYTWKCDTCLR